MNLRSRIENDLVRVVLDIEREQDIERLRQVARLQKSQLEHLIAMLARKCAELEKLKGSGGELQIALKLLEEAQHGGGEAGRAGADAAGEERRRTGRDRPATARRSSRRCHACRCAASWASRIANAPRVAGR